MIKPHTTVIIGCDANCPLGTTADNDDEDSKIIGRNGNTLRRKNKSNYHLRNLLHKQQLRATNFDYAHKRYDTFYHFSTRTTMQLDYFFATKTARPSIHDVKRVSNGIESDHAAVMLKLHLQKEKRATSGYQGSRPKRSPIDWRELKGDKASTYAGIVQENSRKQCKRDQTERDTLTSLNSIMIDAAKEVIPNPRKQTPDWFKHSKGELQKAIDERNQSYSEASTRMDDERLKEVLRRKWARLRKVVQQAKQRWVIKMA